jgi:hypothetical protein
MDAAFISLLRLDSNEDNAGAVRTAHLGNVPSPGAVGRAKRGTAVVNDDAGFDALRRPIENATSL